MKKYWQIFKISWQNTLVYRLNFTMWQVRTILSFLTIYFFWLAVFSQYAHIGDYSRMTMFSYLVIAAFLRNLVLWTNSYRACVEIANGDLNNYLVRPINYFYNWLARDWADKALNLIFFVPVLALLIFIFKIPLTFSLNLVTWLSFILLAFLGSLLYFLYSFIISSFSFWYPEHDGWPLRFVMLMFLDFLSGIAFPLDIFPQSLVALFKLLPTSYFVYYPAQVFLGRLSLNETISGFIILLAWLGLFIILTKLVWRKGLKIYGAYGR